MHTTKINQTVFIHDGDYGGDVEIRTGRGNITMPFLDLKGFIADYVRNKRIGKLESDEDDDDKILGI